MRGAKFFAFFACIWWLGEGHTQPGETQAEKPPLKIKSITYKGKGEFSEEVPVDAGNDSMPDPTPTELDVRASEPGIIDLLQARDGAPILGRIQGYAGSMLRFVKVSGESVSVPRPEVVAIDLDVNRQTPDSPLPLQLEPDQDLVVLNDGAMLTGKLSVITSEIVGTTKRVLPRDQVDLIVIAPEPDDGGAIMADELDDDTVDPPEPPADTDGTEGDLSESNITRLPDSTDPVTPCPEDQPLGGWVRVNYEFNYGDKCRSEVDQLAWFPLVYGNSHGPRDPLDWNDSLSLLIAPVVSYEVSHDNCDDLPDDDQVCEAQGADMRARLDWKEAGVQVRFDPMRPTLEVSFPDQVRPKRRYSCRNVTGVGEGSLNPRHGKHIRIRPSTELTNYHALGPLDWYHDAQFVIEVEPGACWQAQYPQVVECVNHRDRYAVIPFGHLVSGANQSKVLADRQAVPAARLDWRVCCGCGRKPAGGLIPIADDTFNAPEEDDCYRETYYLQSWYEQALAQVSDELADAYAEFEQYRLQFEKDHPAYREAMKTCGLRDVVLTVMGEWLFRGFRHVARPPAGRLALPPRSGALIPRAPSESGMTVNQFKRIMTALTGLSGIAEASKLITGDEVTDQLKQRLFGCASILPQDVYDAALRFIQNRREIGRVAQKMGHYYSKLVQTQLEYYFAMMQPYQECLVCANEKGISRYDCWYSTVSPGTPPWNYAKPTHPEWRHEMNYWLELFGNIFNVDVPSGFFTDKQIINRFGDRNW